ncbi:putative immunoglobulin-blocking virulence protein [Mycoplasma procyoni]|uniref:putative immunoglobulin-blocking virulence protein n=1 Tax=Mycoplasma procyoni TaxID=568784 RepID=UPI00197BA2FB|nr:putative immunoglobulin-blocking virulence protein [Mycoplasma procyoni]MBN3534739.1 putative immunoglobulin-blocking virulence protein [Mycoplasma procyoni]
MKKSSKKYVKIAALSTSIAIPATVSSLLYFSSSDNSNSIEKTRLIKDNTTQLNSNVNLNFQDATDSIRDKNLKPKPQVPKDKAVVVEPKVEPTPTPEPKEPEQPPKPQEPQSPKQPEPDPIETETKPEPPKEPEKEQTPPPVVEVAPEPKPNPPASNNNQDTDTKVIDFQGTPIVVRVKKVTERIQDPEDINFELTNRIDYMRDISDTIVSVNVTDEIRQANQKSAAQAISKRTFNTTNIEYLTAKNTELFNIKDYIRQNQTYYQKEFDKFRRLIENGDKVYEFLKPEGQKIYYSELKKIEDKNEKYARIIGYLDPTKFTKTSENVNQFLEKGLVIENDNSEVYINENGELDAYVFSPLINKVVDSRKRDNSVKRVFGYNDQYGRNAEDIKAGVYRGWNSKDVTNDARFSAYNVSKSDGFTIRELTRQEPQEGQRNKGLVVDIDVSNASGYSKTLNFIKQAKANNLEITSYRIKNIGLKDSNQQFFKIFKELPDKLPQLELFFETENSGALIALEKKEIDELSLYTTRNSLTEGWSLNPLALRKTAWVNTIDYNVSSEYAFNYKPITRITFNSLSFEESDLGPENSPNRLTRINNGLRMAYFVRNNEAIFQGGLGPGLDPDHNEGGNSYPTGLDLSRVPSLKSLRGLIFEDTKKPQNGLRKLRRLVLYNKGPTFEIDADELNNAQFSKIIDTNPRLMPKSKIVFNNKSETKNIRIISKNGVNKLTSVGISNLNTLINFSDNTFSSSTQFSVGQNDDELYNQLKGLGKKVEKVSVQYVDADVFA